MAPLNILQWNAQSVISKRPNLELLLAQYNIHVALLCETWFKPNHCVNFKNFHVIRHDRQDGYAGVAILIDKKNPFTFVDFSETIRNRVMICGVTLSLGLQRITVVSMYRTSNNLMTTSDYVSILNVLPNPYILGGI